MLRHATSILERQIRGASMLQLNSAGILAQAFDTMVQASLIGTADAARLTALPKKRTKMTMGQQLLRTAR